MENKEYVIWVSRAGHIRADGSSTPPERVVKTEEELTPQDYNLFLADLIETFNKCPDRTQIEFLGWVYRDNMGG
jgi:hypothetical protein